MVQIYLFNPWEVLISKTYIELQQIRERITTQGLSVGLNYYLGDNYSINGNYSWNVLNKQSDDPIIPSFNTPANKFNIGFRGRDLAIK